MSDGGYPAIGADDGADSPLPAGYGALDAGFPSAEQEVLDRRREARANGGSGRRDDPPVMPARPWARRARAAAPAPASASASAEATAAPPAAPAPVGAPPSPAAPSPAAPSPAAPSPAGPAPAGPLPAEGPSSEGAPAGRRLRREPPAVARYADADVVEGPVRGSRRPRQKVRVVRGIRSRRLVRRLDVWTVFKVSLVFYLLALVVLVVSGVIMWNVASTLGFIHSIDKSIRTLFSLKTFVLHPTSTLEYGTAIGGLLCLLGVVVNTLAAVAYNLISDLVGGVQVVVVSEPD